MKILMRIVPLLVLTLVLAAPSPQDLTVHEWGTFTSIAGEDGLSVDWDTLGCRNDLPAFVNDYGYRGFKFRLMGTVRMETPVIYFYSPRELDAQVKVSFPKGVITEWYPRADNNIYQPDSGASLRPVSANLNGFDTSLRSVTGAIEWKNVRVQPETAPVFPVDHDGSRYYAARATDAAPVTAGGQQEKFLFYRGVGRFPVPLAARVSGEGAILVENRGADSVPGVILFENRHGRIGYRVAGSIAKSVTLEPPVLDGSLATLRRNLETTLIEHGLYAREARAMVETWKDSWFEEGSRLIYIVPSAAVHAILPLQITPAPSQTVRVFVGRIELVTPVTKQTLESAIARHDWTAVEPYERFLEPLLRRVYPGQPYRVSDVSQAFHKAQGPGCAVPKDGASTRASY